MSGSIDGETHQIYRVVVTYCLENDTDTVDIQKLLDTYEDRVPLEAV